MILTKSFKLEEILLLASMEFRIKPYLKESEDPRVLVRNVLLLSALISILLLFFLLMLTLNKVNKQKMNKYNKRTLNSRKNFFK